MNNVNEINDLIQKYVSTNGAALPGELLKLLSDLDWTVQNQSLEPDLPSPCPEFKPDHNGECLNCDEWYSAHTDAAIEAGWQREDRAKAERKKTPPCLCQDLRTDGRGRIRDPHPGCPIHGERAESSGKKP